MARVLVKKVQQDLETKPIPGTAGHGSLAHLLGGEPKQRVEDVPLSEITTTQRFIDTEKVQRILTQPLDYAASLPILLELDGTKYLMDGHHRVAAAASEGESAIKCRVLFAAAEGTDSKGAPVVVSKAAPAEDMRLVWGEVYAPNRPDVHNEYMDEAAIRDMAHDFLRRKMQSQIDVQHNNRVVEKVTIVESFIARPGDKDFIPGSWVVCCHVNDDETWNKIKSGELNGFSVEALVVKEEKNVTMEVPDRVVGMTTAAADGHNHAFDVRYNAAGKLIGGTTNVVNGHMHRILAGTITEESQGHRHRFSSVDNIQMVE